MPVPAPLVADPDLVTAEWLAAALEASGAATPGARIVAVERTAIGTGQVGQNIRFALRWAEGDGPATVVGKFAAADETSRLAGLLTGTYVREVGFYRDLADRAGARVPACHVAELDPATGEFVLLFEDIAPAEQGDQILGCTPEVAASAVDELARLHVAFWDDPSLRDLEWLVARRESAPDLEGIYQAAVGPFVQQYDDRLSDRARAVVERFAPLVGAWLATDRAPLTLLHVDFRLDNLLFGTDRNAPPVTVVDWQTPSLGAGPSDLAYFLGSGLSVDDRRAHEGALLDRYRAGLAAGGVDLDADGCWASYRANTVAGVHMAVVASVLVGRHERGDEMFLAMIERHAAHVDDLETFAVLEG